MNPPLKLLAFAAGVLLVSACGLFSGPQGGVRGEPMPADIILPEYRTLEMPGGLSYEFDIHCCSAFLLKGEDEMEDGIFYNTTSSPICYADMRVLHQESQVKSMSQAETATVLEKDLKDAFAALAGKRNISVAGEPAFGPLAENGSLPGFMMSYTGANKDGHALTGVAYDTVFGGHIIIVNAFSYDEKIKLESLLEPLDGFRLDGKPLK